MWDIVWVSPQGHRSVSISRHFLLQAPHCPCSVRKRFSRDHCCLGRSKPGCRIVGSHTSEQCYHEADIDSSQRHSRRLQSLSTAALSQRVKISNFSTGPILVDTVDLIRVLRGDRPKTLRGTGLHGEGKVGKISSS